MGFLSGNTKKRQSSDFFSSGTKKTPKDTYQPVDLLVGGKQNITFKLDQIKNMVGNKLNQSYNKFVKEVINRKLIRPEDVRYRFEKIFCNNVSVFENVKSKCSSGGFKSVIMCKKDSIGSECNYVYMFDFKKHDNDMGYDAFMQNGQMDLNVYSASIGASPLYFKSLFISLYNNSRIRIDFMIQPNYGTELFEFLFVPRNKNHVPGSKPNLALSLIFTLTALYTFIILHSKGITHRDLKPENINIGDPNSSSGLIIIDFGLALNNKFPSKDYSYAGTLDYFTPKIAEKVLDDKVNLKYEDYYDLDIHSIGINLVNIMWLNLLQIDKNKYAVCPGKNANVSESKQMCQYLLCHFRQDGTLGFDKKVNSIKYKDRDFNDLFNLLKTKAFQMCQYGFTTYSDGKNSLNIMRQMYNDIITTIRLRKDKLLPLLRMTPVKLNSVILKEIDPNFTYATSQPSRI